MLSSVEVLSTPTPCIENKHLALCYNITHNALCLQAAWLLRAVTCIDLTTLAGDDTPGNVHRLCMKATQPVRSDLLKSMDMQDKGSGVCVCLSVSLPLSTSPCSRDRLALHSSSSILCMKCVSLHPPKHD